MTPSLTQLLIGLGLGLLVLPLIALALRALTVQVDDNEAALVTRFGKHVRTLERPGLHFLPARALPWVRVHDVSLRRDGRRFPGVAVNDARGTSVTVDLWLELRVLDPARATFAVADWQAALPNLVARAATAVLGERTFHEILASHDELADLLRADIDAQTKAWGLQINSVRIRDVHVLPAVARDLLTTINARLERARAEIQERGRLAVASLDADTAAAVAPLVAEARAQYPLAVGRALAELRRDPPVHAAYQQLYALSLLRPHRTVAFRGWQPGEVRAADAAMMVPPQNHAEQPA
ncbi:MAG: SPFH domain-containing protein [Myxococcales bacterium]|nr:SPFH domain-containing protein [Myxococcales bacterium]